MPPPSERLFRPRALERYSSPDNLDQLMHVVGAKDWIPLATIAGLFVVFSVWCVFGSVPTAVTGRGGSLSCERGPVARLGGAPLAVLLV